VLDCGQVAVSGTVPVCAVPPGPASLVLFTSSGTAYVGPGSAVSAASGMAVASVPFGTATYSTSAPETIWATTGNTTSTVSVIWLLSTSA
jgi:hypothetical protein